LQRHFAVCAARAEYLDLQAARERERKQAAAAELRGRCAPAAEVVTRWRAGLPAPVDADVRPRGQLVLAVVDVHVKEGRAGVQLSYAEWAEILGCCEKTALTEIRQLRDSGHLQRVRDSMPTEETALGLARYKTRSIGERRAQARRQGRRARLPPRNVESTAEGSYTRSTVRNLYVLGQAALALRLGRPRCGQALRKSLYVATALSLSSQSGSGAARSDVRTVGPVDMWISRSANDPAEAEIRAPGVEKESLRGSDSLRSPPPLRETIEAAPPAPQRALCAPPGVAANGNALARAAAATPSEEASMERSGLRGRGEEMGEHRRPWQGPGGPDPEGGGGESGSEDGSDGGSD
jgi:hypothetical protein